MSRSATPTTKCHAYHAKRGYATCGTSKSDNCCRTCHIGTTIAISRERLRTVANSCERLSNDERTHPQPPDPQSEIGTIATHSGKTLPWNV